MASPGQSTSKDDAYDSEPMEISSSDESANTSPNDGDSGATRKRKLSTTNGHGVNGGDNHSKRVRVSGEIVTPQLAATVRDLSTVWPNGLWQRVFMQTPPATLFRLSRVNKRFKYLLERAKDLKLPIRRGAHAAQQVDSELIWMQSRRTTYPSMPRPLARLNEAAMLHLVTAQRCEHCKKRFSPTVPTGPLNGGPGPNGVRPIWQFKHALCGPCLVELSMTDLELFKLKGDLRATDLKKGLNSIFLTKDYHIVSETAARQHSNQGIVKVYLRADVDNILHEFKDAQAFGGGAQEEWVKGLEDVGKAAATDALRWQRWEDQLPFGTHLPTQLRKLDPVTFTTPARTVTQHTPSVDAVRIQPSVSSFQHPLPKNTVHPLPKPVHSITFSGINDHGARPTSNTHNTGHNDSSASPTTKLASGRQMRPADEAQQASRARRAEIERRAKLLVPAIEPDVLAFMESYKAAILIGVPLTDADWERLRPRLEAEREHAEQVHYEQIQTIAAFHAANPINWQYPQGILPQSKDDDREWEASQTNLRELLGFYADEVINGTWRAQPLTRELVPYFAADVLGGVFDRYQLHRTAQLESGQPEDSKSFLSLDAMKWIFENKIKPLAEAQLREMFLCAGCSEDGVTKWLAFEGLIQHYGAKHTTDFSKGNITVHWQTAEWTDDPPFVTEVSKLYPKYRKSNHQHASHPAHAKKTQNAAHRPSAGMMLSSNPLFASTSQPAQMMSLFNEDAAQLKLGLVGRQTWAALDGIRGLSDTIRVTAVLSLVKQDFTSFHGIPLPLELFTKAVTINEKDSFSELRAVNSLTCSLCQPTRQQSSESDWIRKKSEKKSYKLVNLFNHFQLAHVQQGVPQSEWINLIDGPERGDILDLLKTPGMNDLKLALVDQAFPGIFPKPLPEIGEVHSPAPDSGLARRLVMKGLGQATKSKKKKANTTREYNPNDAIIPPKPSSGPVDLSAFDTDPQPSDESPAPNIAQSFPPPPSAVNEFGLGQLSLAPETLAALQSLTRGTIPTGQQIVSTIPKSSQPLNAPARTLSPEQSYEPQREHTAPEYDADPNISAIIASLHRGAAQRTPHAAQQYTPQQETPRDNQQYTHHQPPQRSTSHNLPPQQSYQYPEQPQYTQPQYQRPEQASHPQQYLPHQQQYGQPAHMPQQMYHTGAPAYPTSAAPPPPSYQPYGYSQPQYQQAQVPPPPIQQPWAASHQQQQPAAPQMQPVLGNPNLMYDPRTGQYYELVPEGY